jgi:hypothetical protein
MEEVPEARWVVVEIGHRDYVDEHCYGVIKSPSTSPADSASGGQSVNFHANLSQDLLLLPLFIEAIVSSGKPQIHNYT